MEGMRCVCTCSRAGDITVAYLCFLHTLFWLTIDFARQPTFATALQLLGNSTAWHLLRVMPNTPAQVLAGASAMCLGEHATAEDAAVVKTLFEAIGIVQVVKETHMDGASEAV